MIVIDLTILTCPLFWLVPIYVWTFLANCAYFVGRYNTGTTNYMDLPWNVQLFLYCLVSFLFAPVWLLFHILWYMGKTLNVMFGYK